MKEINEIMWGCICEIKGRQYLFEVPCPLTPKPSTSDNPNSGEPPDNKGNEAIIGEPEDLHPVGENTLEKFREVLKILEDEWGAGVEENTDGFIRCKNRSKYIIHSFDIHIEINTEDE